MRYRYLYYFLLLIPAFIFRDYTPANELKYISIAGEALQNGRWFTFYNHGEIYADKPPFYFWLIMLSKLITGGYHKELIGLFSLLPSLGTMAVMDRWIKDEEKTGSPLTANSMLLTTIMFLGTTLVVRMDMLMTFFIVLSLHTFYTVYKNKHTETGKCLLPVYLFLAIFTKGPVGLLIPAVSILAFLAWKKQIRIIGHYLGGRQWLLFFCLCAVWFALVYIEGGKEYLNDLLFNQTIGRGIDSFHHKQPFWFYFPRMLWSFAPWSLLFIVLIWKGLRQNRFSTDLEKFFLTVICASIILLSVVSSKLDIYLLPVYPFVVYLCSILLEKNLNHKAVTIAIGIPAILTVLLLPAAIILKDKLPDLQGYSAFVFAGISMPAAGGSIAIIMLFRKQVLKAVHAVSAGIIGLVFVGSFAIPPVNKYIGFSDMAKSAMATNEENKSVGYAHYKFKTAANMDVYLGSGLRQINSVAGLDSVVQSGQRTILFVRNREIQHDNEFAAWIAGYNPEWSNEEYSWYSFNTGSSD